MNPLPSGKNHTNESIPIEKDKEKQKPVSEKKTQNHADCHFLETIEFKIFH